MKKSDFSSVQGAVTIIKSSFLIVILAYVLDPMIFIAYFDQPVRESAVGIFILIVFTLIQFLFFSGIYGQLFDVASREVVDLNFDGYCSNLKRYWKIFAIFYLFRWLVHFLFFIYMVDKGITLLAIASFLDIIFLFYVAYYLAYDKYIKPLCLSKRAIKVSREMLAVLFVYVLFISVLLNFEKVDQIVFFHLYRIVIVLLKFASFFIFNYFSFVIIGNYPEIMQRLAGKKEVYLICPSSGGIFDAIASMVHKFYPPVFIVLKALTPERYRVREFNKVLWQHDYYAPDKLVAITCFTSNAPDAYKIAKEFKARGSTVVMGGAHVSFLPDEALEYCDSVVVGEAETVWDEIILDYEAGSLKRKYFGPPLEHYFQKTSEAFFQLPPLSISKCLQTGRGCKYNCEFCVISALSGKKIRKTPVSDVVKMLQKVKEKSRGVLFLDDNIFVDPRYAKELFVALKGLNMSWESSSSLDIAKDEKMLKLAKESGCRLLLIGYEISDVSTEKKSAGKFLMADDYRMLSRRLKKTGIRIKAHFIFGFDSDNAKSLWDLWKCCFAIRPFVTVVAVLTPFPGSRVFKQLMQEDRILNLNWRNYSMNELVFNPKGINRTVFNVIYPGLFFFFLTTTSTLGLALLVMWFLF
ncbi:MAG: radical SAM protein [Candidatus Omnitrophica bacterium]|nr:radical SAM protein [Candidatus Omnitrophota bacterium]